ncbi:MAG: sel1 repeat family protein [Alistipes senegalensis]|nr:sel1 repeat family protein [Oxalobacter formigenes]MCM1281849.1 sel1 repeat family protein [Alistipes senegalensis]
MTVKQNRMAQRICYRPGLLFFAAGFFCSVAFAQAEGDAAAGRRLYEEGRYEQALPLMSKAAEAGDREVQYRLCLMFKRGQGMKKPDAQKAYAWCRKSAEQGYGPAEYETAASLYAGLGTEKDTAAALDYYMRASRQGVPEAQYALGMLYESGDGGVTQSYYQARTLYMWASGKGYAPATYRVGTMYEEGKGVRPSMAAALRWYRKAASMGNGDALARLEALKKQEEEMEAAVRAAVTAGGQPGGAVMPGREGG